MDEGFNSWLYVSTKSGYHKNAALRHTRLHHLKGHFTVLFTQSVSWWWCRASYRETRQIILILAAFSVHVEPQ